MKRLVVMEVDDGWMATLQERLASMMESFSSSSCTDQPRKLIELAGGSTRGWPSTSPHESTLQNQASPARLLN
jgi:hypothetical protein